MNVYLNEHVQGGSTIQANVSICDCCRSVRPAEGAIVSEPDTLRSILSNPKYEAILREYEAKLADLRTRLDGRGEIHDILEIAAMLRSAADSFEVAHDQRVGGEPEDRG